MGEIALVVTDVVEVEVGKKMVVKRSYKPRKKLQSQTMLTALQVSQELGVSVDGFNGWPEGRGPVKTRLGPNMVRYRRDDLDKWLENCREA